MADLMGKKNPHRIEEDFIKRPLVIFTNNRSPAFFIVPPISPNSSKFFSIGDFKVINFEILWSFKYLQYLAPWSCPIPAQSRIMSYL